LYFLCLILYAAPALDKEQPSVSFHRSKMSCPRSTRLPEVVINATLEDMKDFPGFLSKLQCKYQKKGGIKVISPPGWKGTKLESEFANLLKHHFAKKRIQPLRQRVSKLKDGIYQLYNNPKTFCDLRVKKCLF
jgi:hypothetical protein